MMPTSAPDLTIDEALHLVLAEARPLPVELVHDPAQAHGRALAHDLHARLDLPGGDTSIMDGWALQAADLAHGAPRPRLRIRGESSAGHPLTRPIDAGEAARIATGAVLPPGADAVVAQEDARVDGDALEIDLAGAGVVRPGHFVRARGSEVRRGELLVAAGAPLGPGELALLYGAGHHGLPVRRRPRVAIVCTGDELLPLGATPGPGQVIGTNALMLAAQIREAGGVPQDLGVAADDLAATRAAIERAAEGADVLLTSGGISVGDHDHVAAALAGLGLHARFRRLALRPGRPLTFGRLGDLLVFALPGNPASTYVTFELFVRPLLRRLAGLVGPSRPRRRLVLADRAEGAGPRVHVVRARLGDDGRATPLPQQRSGSLRSLAGHDALLLVPAGVRELPAGAEVDALLLGEPR